MRKKQNFTINQKIKLENSQDKLRKKLNKYKKHINQLLKETYYLKEKLEEHNIQWRRPLQLTITPFKKEDNNE